MNGISNDGLVNLVSKLGIPRDVGERLTEDEKTRLSEILLVHNPRAAYWLGRETKDNDLIKNAGWKILTDDSKRGSRRTRYQLNIAYDAAHRTGDEELKKLASKGLLKEHLRFTYKIAEDYLDRPLFDEAVRRLLDSSPHSVLELALKSKRSEIVMEAIDVLLSEPSLGGNELEWIYRIGLSRDDEDLIEVSKTRLLEVDPEMAYRKGIESGDKKLIRKAGLKLLEADTPNRRPDDSRLTYEQLAYEAGVTVGDMELIERSRERFAQMDPPKAYTRAEENNDLKLMKQVGWKLIETNQWNAYQAGVKTSDENLMRVAGDEILEIDLQHAYRAADKANDVELLRKVALKYLEDDNIYVAYEIAQKISDDEIVEDILKHVSGDVAVDNKVIRKLYLSRE